AYGVRGRGRRRRALAEVVGELEREEDREQDGATDGDDLHAPVFGLPGALHSALAAHEVPPLVLGAAEVGLDVVVVAPVVVVGAVPVVSAAPGVVAAAICGTCGTSALMVSTACTWGNVEVCVGSCPPLDDVEVVVEHAEDGISQKAMSLTSN